MTVFEIAFCLCYDPFAVCFLAPFVNLDFHKVLVRERKGKEVVRIKMKDYQTFLSRNKSRHKRDNG